MAKKQITLRLDEQVIEKYMRRAQKGEADGKHYTLMSQVLEEQADANGFHKLIVSVEEIIKMAKRKQKKR